MNIILVHSIHGAKVAISKPEMEQDIKNGWSVYKTGLRFSSPPGLEPDLESESESDSELDHVVVKKRPGRPSKTDK